MTCPDIRESDFTKNCLFEVDRTKEVVNWQYHIVRLIACSNLPSIFHRPVTSTYTVLTVTFFIVWSNDDFAFFRVDWKLMICWTVSTAIPFIDISFESKTSLVAEDILTSTAHSLKRRRSERSNTSTLFSKTLHMFAKKLIKIKIKYNTFV